MVISNTASQEIGSEQHRALSQLLSQCRIRRYPPRATIIACGCPPDTLYYITRGSVSVLMENNGREIVLSYLNAGEFFGEAGIFSAYPSEARIVTRNACETAEIPYARFLELATQDPKILFLVASQMATRLRSSSRKVADLAFQDVSGRITRALYDLCTQPDAVVVPDGTQLRTTRQEIARIVGCSREMAGRVLKELQEAGVLRARGKTIVVFRN